MTGIKTILSMFFFSANVYLQFSKVHFPDFSDLIYQPNSTEDNYLSLSFVNQPTHVTIR